MESERQAVKRTQRETISCFSCDSDSEATFICNLCEKVSFCSECKANEKFRGHLASDHYDAFIDCNGQLKSSSVGPEEEKLNSEMIAD